MIKFSPIIISILSFICSLAVSLFSIPNIIYVAKRKRLFDIPDNHRKIHTRIVPNLGGVGIFFAYIIVASICVNLNNVEVYSQWNFIAAASLLLFVTGIKDDLVSVSPSKKFFAQFVASAIVVYFADIRLHSLYGLFGIHDLPLVASYFITVIGFIFISNAFNLIDGIDGLAGSIATLATLVFGVALGCEGRWSEACISFSLMGAICGFLRYNISPAKIFMGDTGSLVIGFSIAMLAVMFINSYNGALVYNSVVSRNMLHSVLHSAGGAFVMALAVLFVPLFDTLRVFTTRSMKGKSPFQADRTHLHHYLLDLGLTHTQTVSTLISANLMIIALAFYVQDYNIMVAIACLFFLAFGLFSIMFFLRRSRMGASVHASVSGIGAKKIDLNPHPELEQPLKVKGHKLQLEILDGEGIEHNTKIAEQTV